MIPAWRRGHRYGTIIFERSRVIDRLPDRTGETLASWLRQHGEGIAVVSRDRAGAYAEGIRAGAPQAVQIANRWQPNMACWRAGAVILRDALTEVGAADHSTARPTR